MGGRSGALRRRATLVLPGVRGASGFAERFLEACGVPEGDRAAAVEQARSAVGAAGIALLEVTVGNGSGSARVMPASAGTAPATAAEPA